MNRTRSFFIAAVLLMAGATLFVMQSQPITAQSTENATLQRTLLDLNDRGERYTIDFGQAVPRLGSSIDLGEGGVLLERAGADVVCLLVPGNTSDQITCVPYTNVISVIYDVR